MDYVTLLRLMLEDTRQDDLARELGTTQPTLSRWLKGQEPRGMSLERIKQVAAKRKLIPSSPNEERPTGDIPHVHSNPGAGSGGGLSVLLDNAGNILDLDQQEGHWSFPDSVKAGWARLNKTFAMKVIGDSMEPTLASGSYVFVDTTHTYPNPPDIYLVDHGDGLVVKRVELIPDTDKAKIIFDNERYENYEVRREDLMVCGRVVAWFQWRG